MTMPDYSMHEALRRQAATAARAHRVDRRGWTDAQWADDAERLMGELDGAVTSLVNGHVLALTAERKRLVAEVESLRAQRDAALAALDAAVAEQDCAATEATAQDADSPAAASARGRAGGVYLAAELVRAALGVQPEPDDG